jgi:endonuclease/exonuclease/phosphatase family metal-dependent hydrolase
MRSSVPTVAVALVVAGAGAGCSLKLQSIPVDHAVESTFPTHAQVDELPEQFKVVTFNVHMEPGDKIVRAMATDRDLVDADLIMLEEVPRKDAACSAACTIGKTLGMYTVFAPGHLDMTGKGEIGVAILSRAPITSAQVIELPWHDVHVNAGRRIALAATLEQGGRPITVYAVHLENRLSADERRAQLVPVLEHARAQQTPVIVAGDFNTNPFHWVDHWLPVPTADHQASRLEALVRSYGFDTPVKDSGATHRYLGMKLDGIYTRGFTTRHFATAHAHDVSDHMALWATVRSVEPPVASRAATNHPRISSAKQ